MDFDFSLVMSSLPLLLQGALVTLKITALSVGLGLIFGLLAGVASLTPYWWVRIPARCYVDFALPVILNTRVDPFVAAVSACSINSGAYVAEIFRAGIQSVDRGQTEAGRSLGLTWFQTMREIVIPQAFKRIIPPLGNEFIAMLKVSVIGFEELTRSGQLIIAQTYGSFEIWTSVAIIYLAMTLTISQFVAFLERKFRTDER